MSISPSYPAFPQKLPESHRDMGFWVGLLLAFSSLFGLIAFMQPLYAPFILGGVFALGVFVLVLLSAPWVSLLTGLLLSSLYLVSEEGIGLGEAIYFGYFAAFILPVSLFRFITGQISFESSIDRWFLLLTLLVPAGAVLGYLNGANLAIIGGDLTFYSFIFAFFAFRRSMVNPVFRRWLIATLLLVCIYVLARNLLNYQQIILEATMEWQAKKARSTSREILMVLGASFFLSAASVTDSWFRRAAALSLVGAFVVGLIITQSRGYWVGCLLSFMAIVHVAQPKQRYRLLVMLITIVVVLTGAVLLLLRDEFLLILSGLAERVLSFGTLSRDISLQERVLESGQILDRMIRNPIAGYGLGVEYPRYYMVPGHVIGTSYVHNGYLSGWFKLGLPGLLAMVAILVGLLQRAFRLVRMRSLSLPPGELTLAMAMSGVLPTMAIVNVTSPQFYSFEGWLLLVVFGAYLSFKDAEDESSDVLSETSSEENR